MDPITLIGPSDPMGLPAPFWFVEFFKVLGFSLHMVPMNLWYAGMVAAAVLGLWGRDNARRLAHRLINVMPIVVALGVNLGIVPLLFVQVAYYKVFYPAGVLMAWPWFSVIVLLTVAYYGVYLYATSVRRAWRPRLGLAAGWVSAALFVAIGFLFSNYFSLMTNLQAWPGLVEQTGLAGAPTGTALNVADVTMWPRWLMMFGLALVTVSAFIVVDTAFFAGKETDAYRRWAAGFAPKLATLGLAWFAVTGSLYIFVALPAERRNALLTGPYAVLTVLTAAGIGLPWLLMFLQRSSVTRRLAVATGLAQYLVLALNAISRQVLQNAELGKYLDVSAEHVKMQWSPLILFLLLFVAALGLVAWMLSQVVAATRDGSAPVQPPRPTGRRPGSPAAIPGRPAR